MPCWFLRAVSLIQGPLEMEEKGQTLIEYALILALIAIVIIGILSLLGITLQDTYETIANSIPYP